MSSKLRPEKEKKAKKKNPGRKKYLTPPPHLTFKCNVVRPNFEFLLIWAGVIIDYGSCFGISRKGSKGTDLFPYKSFYYFVTVAPFC